jgi:hypothetical protein
MDNTLYNPTTPISETQGGGFKNKLLSVFNWIKSHKKIVIVIIGALFLAGFLIFTGFNLIKSRLIPGNKTSAPAGSIGQNANNLSSISIKTSKDAYSLSENILITAIANSNNQSVRGFDVLIEYDPQFLTLTNRKSRTQNDFIYYGSNTGKLLQVSAVQKPESGKDIKFNANALFEFEFKPKKTGKTSFKMVFAPKATNETNLIDKNSKDILTQVYGKEIEIK